MRLRLVCQTEPSFSLIQRIKITKLLEGCMYLPPRSVLPMLNPSRPYSVRESMAPYLHGTLINYSVMNLLSNSLHSNSSSSNQPKRMISTLARDLCPLHRLRTKVIKKSILCISPKGLLGSWATLFFVLLTSET
jgi:hypothetical protein